MRIKDLIACLERIAPPFYQESYDNAGLLVGDELEAAKSALLCLDATEAVVNEAVELDCNLIIAHHPIIFKGLKRLNGRNYVERTVISAIRNGVAIYAIHTNLDNVYRQGINARIASRLGLENTRILLPKAVLKKLAVYVLPTQIEAVRQALAEAGANSLSDSNLLTFNTLGVGTSQEGSQAAMKLEAVFEAGRQGRVVAALKSAAPEAPYEISSIENAGSQVGSGMIGELPKAVKEHEFLKLLKKNMKTSCIRHTALLEKPVKTVALCGGSGSFLLPNAMAQGADVFVTADYKYHDFFDAEGRIVIADIGHYESEQFTMELLQDIIAENFPTFATHLTKMVTNPVQYFY
jgi:dinuclear metal center YbgI/SA1388 family protein